MFDGVILSVDLATRTGWCYGRPDDVPKSGSIRFGGDVASSARRYRAYRKWLSDMITVHHVALVAMEKPQPPSFHHGETNLATLRLLIGLAEHTEELCYERVPLVEASVRDVREHFIGANPRGQVGKKQVQAKCTSLGWEWDDDNAADALALWQYVRSIKRPEFAIVSSPLFGKRVMRDF